MIHICIFIIFTSDTSIPSIYIFLLNVFDDVLNKSFFLGDLEHKRVVRLDQTQNFVDEFQLFNFLISAKTGENVSFFNPKI